MNEIEKILKESKSQIDTLQVPDELEDRLRSALEKSYPHKQTKKKWKMKVAALLIAFILGGYHIDTLAFYTKKLIGYDQVMNSNLKELNQLGNGQVIKKSYTFKNGVTVTLDGVMLDDNQLLMFYTVKDPDKRVDEIELVSHSIEGLLEDYKAQGGYGSINDEKTEMKSINTFESPSIFEKKLKWTFTLFMKKDIDHQEEGEITFTLDKDKAMGHTLKKDIYKKVKIDKGQISIDSILASKTMTRIEGTIQNPIELAIDHMTQKRFRPSQIELELIVNDKKIREQSSGIRTDKDGIKFHKDYDPIVVDLNKIQMKFISLEADYDVNEKIKIQQNNKNKSFKVLNKDIIINEVSQSEEKTFVTITTREDVILSKVKLMIDEKKVSLQKTISDEYNKNTHKRTLVFEGIGQNLELDIQRMQYKEMYNQTIDIMYNNI
ncbi:DUF4179 domain-containing protein [Inediibacterium massiliense]|uniref:DUF4179 domain-containing protein n=1 Tax=Inediibacterium massiliense TaxID=1658111 RepID=UPI0006B45F33|nr:DUF4179 domain-containing protein [Inediibacterium massiliense]